MINNILFLQCRKFQNVSERCRKDDEKLSERCRKDVGNMWERCRKDESIWRLGVLHLTPARPSTHQSNTSSNSVRRTATMVGAVTTTSGRLSAHYSNNNNHKYESKTTLETSRDGDCLSKKTLWLIKNIFEAVPPPWWPAADIPATTAVCQKSALHVRLQRQH